MKSRLVLPFWYRRTWVVVDKGPLNGCVCVCARARARARTRARVRVCVYNISATANASDFKFCTRVCHAKS